MRKLGWVTVGFTYLLMVWGNLVSSTGSGLACPDWPLCHGTVAPGIRFDIVLEWGHRCLAATATLLILATLFQVLRSKQGPESALKKSARSLMALLALQILLGGTTVLLGLSMAVSTIHLIIANLVWGGLITVACVITWNNPVVAHPSAKLRRLAIAGLGGMVVQLALGGLVRHGHAGLACPLFPNCLPGSFLPFPFFFETAVAFFHRWWGIALLGVFVQIAVAARRESPALRRAATSVLILAVFQVFLGIATVLSGIRVDARAFHAAIGYALWGSLFYIAIRSGGLSWLWSRGNIRIAPISAASPLVTGHSS